MTFYWYFLVEKHPNMKRVVVDEVERLLYRPNISLKAQWVVVFILKAQWVVVFIFKSQWIVVFILKAQWVMVFIFKSQ
jgi:hypothetical protein